MATILESARKKVVVRALGYTSELAGGDQREVRNGKGIVDGEGRGSGVVRVAKASLEADLIRGNRCSRAHRPERTLPS